MPLQKIKDFDPDYRNYFGDHDILGYDLYSGNEKVGSIDDLLVDDEGRFRYLVVNTGAWIFGKKVLLPIGRARISYSDRRIYVDGLTRSQVENLPDYKGNETLDYDQEERVRGVYRPTTGVADTTTAVDTTGPVDTAATAGTAGVAGAAAGSRAYNRDVDRDVDRNLTGGYDRNTYTYDRDPSLYNLNDRDHENLRLYEERLIANKTRQKTGEAVVGKRVETETQHVSVPVERERVVIERTTPADAGTPVTPGADAFSEGEAVRMEIYEETPDIRKEAVVREEVKVRKEVDRDTVESDETIRRERLDVDKQGRVIDGPNDIVDDRNRRI